MNAYYILAFTFVVVSAAIGLTSAADTAEKRRVRLSWSLFFCATMAGITMVAFLGGEIVATTILGYLKLSLLAFIVLCGVALAR